MPPMPERRPRLYVVALSHLDTQWRWTVRETANVLPPGDGAGERGPLPALPALPAELRRRLPLPAARRVPPGGCSPPFRRASPKAAGFRPARPGRRSTPTCRRPSRSSARFSTARATSNVRSARPAGTSSCPTASASRRRFPPWRRTAESSVSPRRSCAVARRCARPSASLFRSGSGSARTARRCRRCSTPASTGPRPRPTSARIRSGSSASGPWPPPGDPIF